MAGTWASYDDPADFEPSLPSRTAGTAPQACLACRKQKRRCDKALPICSLCQRIGRACDYSVDGQAQAQQPSNNEFEALRQKVADLEGLLSRVVSSSTGSNTSIDSMPASRDISTSTPLSQISPPSLGSSDSEECRRSTSDLEMGFLFLDSFAFDYARSTIKAPLVKVPTGALAALGSSFDLREMIETYFASVHTFFPIVSKIRLYQHLSNDHHDPGADLALLFMTMKLVNSTIPPESSAQTPLYQDIKQLYAYTESRSGISIHTIQALILISLYETGHGIYPAAYLTTGHAARLGHAMGLHRRNAPQMLRRPNTWTEQEERRRVWWAILILDRFVNIGARAKPFATAEPSLDTCLPTDDEPWDRGKMVMTAPLALSATQTVKNASPFARTCQAAHLLGKIIGHMNDDSTPQDFRYEEALQLNRATRTLLAVIAQEASQADPHSGAEKQFCTSMALCLSAVLILYDAYSCSENLPPDASETRLIMQQESIAGISDASTKVLELAGRVRQGLTKKALLQKFSPLVIDCFYQAAGNYAWYFRESSDQLYERYLLEMKATLKLIDQRWKVAGQYIYNLERFWERGEEPGQT